MATASASHVISSEGGARSERRGWRPDLTTLLSVLQGAYMTACRTGDLGVIAATFDAAARTVINPPTW